MDDTEKKIVVKRVEGDTEVLEQLMSKEALRELRKMKSNYENYNIHCKGLGREIKKKTLQWLIQKEIKQMICI